jgi:hypothetical protein
VLGVVVPRLVWCPVAVARSVTGFAWSVVRSQADPTADRSETNRLLAALLDAQERGNAVLDRLTAAQDQIRDSVTALVTPAKAPGTGPFYELEKRLYGLGLAQERTNQILEAALRAGTDGAAPVPVAPPGVDA